MDNETKYSTYFALDIMVHTLILFTFLSLFFFLYVSKIEQKAFENEIGDLIEDSLTKILDKDKASLKTFLSPLKPVLIPISNLYSGPSQYSRERNTLVKFSAIFVAVLLICCILSIIITLQVDCHESVHMGHIIVENIIVFICIGIIEFWFFSNVAIKYIPTSPSLMINTMFTALKKQLNPQS